MARFKKEPLPYTVDRRPYTLLHFMMNTPIKFAVLPMLDMCDFTYTNPSGMQSNQILPCWRLFFFPDPSTSTRVLTLSLSVPGGFVVTMCKSLSAFSSQPSAMKNIYS